MLTDERIAYLKDAFADAWLREMEGLSAKEKRGFEDLSAALAELLELRERVVFLENTLEDLEQGIMIGEPEV